MIQGRPTVCRTTQKFVWVCETKKRSYGGLSPNVMKVFAGDGSFLWVMDLFTGDGSSYDGRVSMLHIQFSNFATLPHTETPREFLILCGVEFDTNTHTGSFLDTTWSLLVSTAN